MLVLNVTEQGMFINIVFGVIQLADVGSAKALVISNALIV